MCFGVHHQAKISTSTFEISTCNLQIALRYAEHPLCRFPPGAQCFLAQMSVQRAELLERLSTAHNFSNLDYEDNYIAASKAVRQVSERRGLGNDQ